MSVRFQVLGSGSAFPSAACGHASHLLHTDEGVWLVDAGPGALQRCAQAGVAARDLAGVVISHQHPDHTGELGPLLFALRLAPTRATALPLIGGEGLGVFLTHLEQVWGRWVRPPGGVLLSELSLQQGSELRLGALTLRARPATHSGAALLLRFEVQGRALVYTGDTGPCPAVAELCRGADLLVSECGRRADDPHLAHLCAEDVAAVVRASGVPEVWLTHLGPGVEPHAAQAVVAAAGARVHIAADGDVWAN